MLGTESYTVADHTSRGVDLEHLRALGKQASAQYTNEGMNLNDAVVGVLRDESALNQEHVRRVVEFANNYAFEQAFTKSAADHRVIDFAGGPADPSKVLQELRSESETGMVAKTAGARLYAEERFIPGQDGLRMRTGQMEKTASAAKQDYPWLNPARELFELRDLVKTANEQMQARLITSQVAYDEAVDEMCKIARDVVRSGHSPAEVARIYADRSPNLNLTKLALKEVSKRVTDLPAVSMTKYAGDRVVNPAHPLCATFDHFTKVATEMFTVLSASESLTERLARVNAQVKSVVQ